jgi:hypothetical protein
MHLTQRRKVISNNFKKNLIILFSKNFDDNNKTLRNYFLKIAHVSFDDVTNGDGSEWHPEVN